MARICKPTTIFFIAGEGGHIEQARRILAFFDPKVRSASQCILITDSELQQVDEFDDCWMIATCAPKHRLSRFGDYFSYAKSSAKCVWRMMRKHDARVAIVTGPGFALIPALAAKAMGAQLLVFETWSRFETRSNCSKVLYHFANRFYVQHEKLLKLYPNATWVGLL